jgi:hypothetical protein
MEEFSKFLKTVPEKVLRDEEWLLNLYGKLVTTKVSLHQVSSRMLNQNAITWSGFYELITRDSGEKP